MKPSVDPSFPIGELDSRALYPQALQQPVGEITQPLVTIPSSVEEDSTHAGKDRESPATLEFFVSESGELIEVSGELEVVSGVALPGQAVGKERLQREIDDLVELKE